MCSIWLDFFSRKNCACSSCQRARAASNRSFAASPCPAPYLNAGIHIGKKGNTGLTECRDELRIALAGNSSNQGPDRSVREVPDHAAPPAISALHKDNLPFGEAGIVHEPAKGLLRERVHHLDRQHLAVHGELGKCPDPFYPFCERAAVALLFPEPFFKAPYDRILFGHLGVFCKLHPPAFMAGTKPSLKPVDLVLLCGDLFLQFSHIRSQAFDHAIQYPHPLIVPGLNRCGRRLRYRGGRHHGIHVEKHLIERLSPYHPCPDLIEVVTRRNPLDEVPELAPGTGGMHRALPRARHARGRLRTGNRQ